MNRAIAAQALLLLPLYLFFGAYSVGSDASIAPMEKTEQEALYSAVQGLVGKWWNGSGLYPDPCGWTPIQGVSCDLFGDLWYITGLSIGPVLDNSLGCASDASISRYLFELKRLRSLTFFNCFSSPIHNPTTIPSRNWEKLAGSLQTMEFRSNRGLVGEIPESIGILVNLQSLVLVENSITGGLPERLGNLVQLKRLALAGNRLTGQIPGSIGANLAELLVLDLSRNSLTGPLPPFLGGMASLLKLDLSSNLLDGKLPWELGRLWNLTLLDLRNNNLSGGLTQTLQGLVSIQDLLLSNNPMGGNLLKVGWENLKNLTTLDLSNMGLTGEIPESMTGVRRLRFLALDNNYLSGSVSPKLAALPHLTALYLNKNNFKGELSFSGEFYQRMGRRFACWDNPNLCYNVAVVDTEHRPPGVEQCKHEQKLSLYNQDSGNKAGNENPDQSSSCMVSRFWWVILILWLH